VGDTEYYGARMTAIASSGAEPTERHEGASRLKNIRDKEAI
jgi:hypothetical protein